MEADSIQQQLGGCGRYQSIVYILLSLVYMRGAWHTFGSIYLGGVPDHLCKNTSSPMANMELKTCEVEIYWNQTYNETFKCHNWTYSKNYYTSTIVSEWDLVCDDNYLVDLSTTIYMIGTMFGALLLTPLSDRYGRKPLVITCLLLQAVIGSCVALSPNYATFTVLRCAVGFLNMGTALSAYVLMTELFPASHRTLPSIGIQNFWAIGVMTLALFGYLVRDWWHLQLLISLPNLGAILFIWFLPESLPWLLSKKRLEKAKSVIKWTIKWNKLSVSPNSLIQTEESPDASTSLVTNRNTDSQTDNRTNEINKEMDFTSRSRSKKGDNESEKTAKSDISALDLVRTPRIRLYAVVMWFLFFVNSLSYFGISFNTPNLHGNPYFNLFLMGLVEIPAYLICMLIIYWGGRRLPVCIFLLICGVCSIAGIFVPTETGSGVNLFPLKLTLVMVGKFGITGSYSTIYLLAAEIFPTAVRNQAVGIASFFENIGSISAPFIVYGAKHIPQLPLAVFGALTLGGAATVMLLPETKNRPLPDTVEEIESWGNKAPEIPRNEAQYL